MYANGPLLNRVLKSQSLNPSSQASFPNRRLSVLCLPTAKYLYKPLVYQRSSLWLFPALFDIFGQFVFHQSVLLLFFSYCNIQKAFLVGAFSFKEKSPTITVASFFSFFRQTTELIAYVPLFTETDKTTQANGNLVQRVPPFIFYLFYVTYKTGRDQRVEPFNFFSALCEIFFENFLRSQKSPPFEFF